MRAVILAALALALWPRGVRLMDAPLDGAVLWDLSDGRQRPRDIDRNMPLRGGV